MAGVMHLGTKPKNVEGKRGWNRRRQTSLAGTRKKGGSASRRLVVAELCIAQGGSFTLQRPCHFYAGRVQEQSAGKYASVNMLASTC